MQPHRRHPGPLRTCDARGVPRECASGDRLPPPPPVTPLPSDAVGPLAAEVGGGDAGARGPTGGPCDTPPPGPPRYGAPLGRRISGFWLRRRDVSPRAALGFRPFASPVLNPPSFFSTPQFLPPPSPAPFARVAPQHRPPREGHCTPRQRRPVGHPGLDPPELCLPLALLSLPLLAPPPGGSRAPGTSSPGRACARWCSPSGGSDRSAVQHSQ